MDSEKLGIAIDIFGESIVNEVQNQLKLAGKDVTGNLIKSIDYKRIKSDSGFNIRLLASNYYSIVDLGRKPGTYPNITAISKWVDIKGIPQSAVFPIAHKIFRDGIEPSNITDKTIQQITRNQAYNRFEEDATDWVDNMIDEMIDNLLVSRTENLGKVKFKIT